MVYPLYIFTFSIASIFNDRYFQELLHSKQAITKQKLLDTEKTEHQLIWNSNHGTKGSNKW